MLIKGFTGVSLIDFPGHIASIIFVGGCNFRCPFCHNPELVVSFTQLPDFNEGEIFKRLAARIGFIDGVEITGGEPLIFKEIKSFIVKLKELGLKVKLDTNGYFPKRLANLINGELLDYVALDLKAVPKKYPLAVGKKIDFKRIKESLQLLCESRITFEVRTTVVPGLVEEKDMEQLAELASGTKLYALQQFRNLKTLNPHYRNIEPYPPSVLKRMAEILRKKGIKRVEIRGV